MSIDEKIEKYLNERINNIEDILTQIKEKGYVGNIGQIDKKVVQKLDKMVKKGKINKDQAKGPWISSGTSTKSIYYRSDLSLNKLQNMIE